MFRKVSGKSEKLRQRLTPMNEMIPVDLPGGGLKTQTNNLLSTRNTTEEDNGLLLTEI